jgi:hypothetical protein
MTVAIYSMVFICLKANKKDSVHVNNDATTPADDVAEEPHPSNLEQRSTENAVD